MAQLRWESDYNARLCPAAVTPRGRLLLCATQRLTAGDSSRGKATPGLEQALKVDRVLGRSAAGQLPASQHNLGLAAGNLESHRALMSHTSSQCTTGFTRGLTHPSFCYHIDFPPVLQLMVLVITEPIFSPPISLSQQHAGGLDYPNCSMTPYLCCGKILQYNRPSLKSPFDNKEVE